MRRKIILLSIMLYALMCLELLPNLVQAKETTSNTSRESTIVKAPKGIEPPELAATVSYERSNVTVIEYCESFREAWRIAGTKSITENKTVTLKLYKDVTDQLGSNPGSYPMPVTKNSKIILDLNGHTINRNCNDTNGSNTKGQITGGNGNYGAVYIRKDGNFTMNGGRMIENHVDSTAGSAMVIDSASELRLSGNPVIKDNASSTNVISSICLEKESKIHITGPLSADAQIGISSTQTNYPLVIGYGDNYTLKDSDVARIMSDNPTLTIYRSGNNIMLNRYQSLTASDFIFKAPSDTTYDGNKREATVEAKDPSGIGAVTLTYYDSNGNPLSEAPVNAGMYSVKIDVEKGSRYQAVKGLTDPSWEFLIVEKVLHVFVADLDVNYGQTLPELNVQVTGFAEGEDETSLPGFTKPTVTALDKVDTTDTSLTKFSLLYLDGGNSTANYTFVLRGFANITIHKVPVTDKDYSVNGDLAKWQDKDITILPANGYTLISTDNSNWNPSLTMTNEGIHKVTLRLKNPDGTTTEPFTLTGLLDKTPPTDVQIQFNDEAYRPLSNVVNSYTRFIGSIEAKATAKDALSGIESYQYYFSETAITDYTDVAWKDSFLLDEIGKKGILYVKVTDKAGNSIIVHEGIQAYAYPIITITPEPTIPGNPDSPEPVEPREPETGDSSELSLWITLIVMSGVALAAVLLISKDRKKNN